MFNMLVWIRYLWIICYYLWLLKIINEGRNIYKNIKNNKYSIFILNSYVIN